jgi:hypothetical protein
MTSTVSAAADQGQGGRIARILLSPMLAGAAAGYVAPERSPPHRARRRQRMPVMPGQRAVPPSALADRFPAH